MKANELRIGNFVYGNLNADTVFIITGINNYDDITTVHASCNIDGYNGILALEDEFNPIQLTEDWLIKFGFEKTEDLGDIIYYELNGNGNRRYVICNNQENWEFSLTIRDDYTILIYNEPFFQYVHHLQNLWYSLNGKELECSKP